MQTIRDNEPRDSISLDEAMPIWWAGTMLTRLDQRPDLLREFYTRWDDWRANGMTPAETQEFWSWLRRHAVINLQAMTVEAHEPCS